MKCPNCGAEVADSMRFCGQCGTKIVMAEKKICPNCKTEGPLTIKFCGCCGYKFPEDGTAAPAPADNANTVQPEIKKEGLTVFEKETLKNAERDLYEYEDFNAAIEKLTPVYQAHSEDEEVVPLYLTALSKINPDKAKEKLNALRTDILGASMLKIEMAINENDLTSAEKELNKAVSLWPGNILVICHQILYTLALYDQFKTGEWLNKAADLLPQLESAIAVTKLERSWKAKMQGLLDEKQEINSLAITRSYCSDNDLYYKLAKNSLADSDEELNKLLDNFNVYNPSCSLKELLNLEEKFHNSTIQFYICETYYQQKNYDKAFEYAKKSAAQDNPDGIARLGCCYVYGYGTEKDIDKGKALVEKAVEAGSSYGQNTYGYMNQYGIGVQTDVAKAFDLYELSAEAWNPIGTTNLAYMYYNGYGTTKNYEKAAEYYRQAATKGWSEAAYNVGLMYGEGTEIKQDYSQAFKYMEKAASKGNSKAQNYVGWLYDTGNGVQQNYTKACQWFQKAADQGNEVAQSNLGLKYENGQGVEKNLQKAQELYRKASDNGYILASVFLANTYNLNNGNFSNEAVALYKKAAEAENYTGISKFSAAENVTYSNWDKCNFLEDLCRKFTNQKTKDLIGNEIKNIDNRGINAPVGKLCKIDFSGNVVYNAETEGHIGLFHGYTYIADFSIDKITNASNWHTGTLYLDVLMMKEPIYNGTISDYQKIYSTKLGSSHPNSYWSNIKGNRKYLNQPDTDYPYIAIAVWESCQDGKRYLVGWYNLPDQY